MFRDMLIAAIVAGLFLLSSEPAGAQGKDFSLCDGLTGAAWGLCRGGVAVGCDEATGNPAACESIETTILNVTGSEAPWIADTPECPCDYSVVDKTATEWQPPPGAKVVFACSVGLEFISDEQPLPNLTRIVANIGFDVDGSTCTITKDGDASGAFTAFESMLSAGDRAACRQDIIDYGIALKGALEGTGVEVNDLCTPTLSP